MRKSNPKPNKAKALALFFIKGFIVLVLALLPGVLVMYKFDPYLFLGTQPSPRIYVPNERFQIPGMARHEDYDTIILGTSMIENFSDKYVSEKLGAKALRLPLNASYITEQKMILDMAQKHRDVKTVIWGIDYRTVDIPLGELYTKNVKLPEYMYDEKGINDWKYVVNHNNFYLALKQYQMRKTGVNPYKYFITDREVLNTWNWQRFGRDLLLTDYKDLYMGKKDVFDKINHLPLEVIQKTVDEELIKTIEKYPDTRFVLLFPPKSILWFKLLDQKNMLEDKLEALTYVVDKAVAYDNVEVYNFQNVFELTEDIDIYLDITHYSNKGNIFMTDAIAKKQYMTNPESFRRDCKELIDRVRSDEINKLAENALK